MGGEEDTDTCQVADSSGVPCGKPNVATISVPFEAIGSEVIPGVSPSVERMCAEHAEGVDRVIPTATVEYDEPEG
jgi:hypothetical protein